MFKNTKAIAEKFGSAYKWLAKASIIPFIGLYKLSKNCGFGGPSGHGDVLGFLFSLPIFTILCCQLPLWLIGGPIALGLTCITFPLSFAAAAITTAAAFFTLTISGLVDIFKSCCGGNNSAADYEKAKNPLAHTSGDQEHKLRSPARIFQGVKADKTTANDGDYTFLQRDTGKDHTIIVMNPSPASTSQPIGDAPTMKAGGRF